MASTTLINGKAHRKSSSGEQENKGRTKHNGVLNWVVTGWPNVLERGGAWPKSEPPPPPGKITEPLGAGRRTTAAQREEPNQTTKKAITEPEDERSRGARSRGASLIVEARPRDSIRYLSTAPVGLVILPPCLIAGAAKLNTKLVRPHGQAAVAYRGRGLQCPIGSLSTSKSFFFTSRVKPKQMWGPSSAEFRPFFRGGGGFNEVETILTSEPADGDASLLRSRTDSQRQFHSIGRFGVSRTSAATTKRLRESSPSSPVRWLSAMDFF